MFCVEMNKKIVSIKCSAREYFLHITYLMPPFTILCKNGNLASENCVYKGNFVNVSSFGSLQDFASGVADAILSSCHTYEIGTGNKVF